MSHPFRDEPRGCPLHGQLETGVCRRCGAAMCDGCSGWLGGCDRCAANARRRGRWLRRTLIATLSVGAVAFGAGIVCAPHDEIPIDFRRHTQAPELHEYPEPGHIDLLTLAQLQRLFRKPLDGCSCSLVFRD
jgi:hypothetical protein